MKIEPSYFILINIIFVSVIVFLLVRAYQKGFIRQVLDLISLVATYIISGMLCGQFATILPFLTIENTSIDVFNTFQSQAINSFIWFCILTIIFRVLYWIVIHLSKALNKIKPLSFVNQVLGFGVGMIKVVLIFMMITLFFKLPIFENGQEFIENSILVVFDEGFQTMFEPWKE